jgi:transposase
MNRYELTEFEWCVIAPLLPNKPRRVPRAGDRRHICARLLFSGDLKKPTQIAILDEPGRCYSKNPCFNRW